MSGLIILTVGILDDLRHVAPRRKLLFQMLAATVLIGAGLVIRRCDFFGVFQISLGVMSVPFTLFWVVGSCNAFNFIDGLDRLASGIGVVVSLFLAALSFHNGAYVPTVLCLAVSGALLSLLLFKSRILSATSFPKIFAKQRFGSCAGVWVPGPPKPPLSRRPLPGNS